MILKQVRRDEFKPASKNLNLGHILPRAEKQSYKPLFSLPLKFYRNYFMFFFHFFRIDSLLRKI